MNNRTNRTLYRLWAPVYDVVFGPLFARARRSLYGGLTLQPDERLLLPGVGTGQDLAFIPGGVTVVAGDYSPAMLAQAQAKPQAGQAQFQLLDAQHLPYSDAAFDVVVLALILSVVPDGTRAFAEAWRVLRPGGRMAIFDKFVSEDQALTPLRRLLGWGIRHMGTDPNRRLADLMAGAAGVVVAGRQPSLVRGQYQLIWLHKQALTHDP